MLIVEWAGTSGSTSTTDLPISSRGMTLESLMTLNDAGEQFPIMFPLSTSNAWQKRDTLQDRNRRCNKGYRG